MICTISAIRNGDHRPTSMFIYYKTSTRTVKDRKRIADSSYVSSSQTALSLFSANRVTFDAFRLLAFHARVITNTTAYNAYRKFAFPRIATAHFSIPTLFANQHSIAFAVATNGLGKTHYYFHARSCHYHHVMRIARRLTCCFHYSTASSPRIASSYLHTFPTRIAQF